METNKNNLFEDNTSAPQEEPAGFPWDEGDNATEQENTPAPCAKKSRSGALSAAYDYAETFCYALAVMMLLFLFVFRYVSVDGQSMRETLQHRDKLIISNLFYTPKTGDIVVIKPDGYRSNNEPLIKRVIATEGQTVLIDYQNWQVYVDGVPLEEPYIEGMREPKPMDGTTIPDYTQEFVVGDGKVFVMGDNRNHSTDSRVLGEIGANRILGRVIIRVAPNFGTVD